MNTSMLPQIRQAKQLLDTMLATIRAWLECGAWKSLLGLVSVIGVLPQT